jgi:hypothetical protein
MRNKIGWWKRDANGQKFQVQLGFFARNLTWHRQSARFEAWEPYEPDEEDWEQAEQDMDNRFKRGLIRDDILELVRQRGKLP